MTGTSRQPNRLYIDALIACLLIVLNGCASHQIDIDSIPTGAAVFEVSEKGTMTKLGKTPIRIDNKADLDRRNLLVELGGHLPKQIMIVYPYASQSRIVVYLTALDSTWFDQVLSVEYADKVDNVVADLLRLQTLLSRGEQDEKTLSSFSAKYSKFSAYHTILGMYYFRAGRINDAITSLEEAIRRNKDNETARTVLQLLRRQSKR